MASLLIGNGINYLGRDVVVWSDLLESLIQKIGKIDVINTDEKPFLHLYEEIFTRAKKHAGKEEKDIKQYIVEEIKTMKPNSYHKKITDLPFENILTLNYDYNFTGNIKNVKNKEVKYSLRRHQEINNKKIWHIHGELDNQHSIILGYSHYMDSINNIQSYLNSSKENEKNNDTWVDIFLNNDIYILGAGLDFEELDIWWLLSYKNRQSLEGKNYINNKKIIYIDIVSKEYDGSKMLQEQSNCNKQLAKSEIKEKKNKSKIDMLKIFGVEIIPFELDNSNYEYQNAYDSVIDYFKKQLAKDNING